MTTLVVHPASSPLLGSVPIPSEPALGRVALIVGAIGWGRTSISGFSPGPERSTVMGGLRALGVQITDAELGEIQIDGVGLDGFRPPEHEIDCGSSLGAMCSFAALLSSARFGTTLVGDPGLSVIALKDVVTALRSRGAALQGRSLPGHVQDVRAPLTVGPLAPDRALLGLELESSQMDGYVKDAALLSGLYASEATRVRETSVSRDHVERMLSTLGAPIRTAGPIVEFDPTRWNRRWDGFAMTLPGDASAASVLVAAAQMVRGSDVTIRRVGTNPTRTGFFRIALDVGAGLEMAALGDSHGEPIATLRSWSAPLRPVQIGGETLARSMDELPLICAIASCAEGTSGVRGVGDLCLEATAVARLRSISGMLRAFGVRVDEASDGLDIHGSAGPLEATEIHCREDARIGMAAAVLALRGRAPSRICEVSSIAATYPKFVATLRALGARLEVLP